MILGTVVAFKQTYRKSFVMNFGNRKKKFTPVPPPSAIDGFPLDQLDTLLAKCPSLTSAERRSFVADLKEVRSKVLSSSNYRIFD
jgi:hypothetical protein